MTNPFMGQITPVGFGFAPRGWLSCEGQLLPIAQNTALFSLLGTTFGGDGRTTFGLPDLRGRSPVGQGTGPGLSPIRWGEKTGAQDSQLAAANIPSHTHTATLRAREALGNVGTTTGSSLAQAADANLNPLGLYSTAAPDANMNAGSITVGATGSGSPSSFTNRSPFLGLWYVIANAGQYPSRS